MKIVSASDANRHFSALLREVSAGETVNIHSRGKWVATLTPAARDQRTQETAKQALFERLSGQVATGARNWTRDDLYEPDA